MKDPTRLLLIVLAAITTRVLALWVGRAEFTGWLNHNYYYFVQVRGLLEDGNLPYNDMPLLFYLYALVARVFAGLGIDPDTAIVASTRLIMSLVPSLIPVAIYGIIKGMNRLQPIQRNQWIIILLSGFLPLSISYLPEYLQKNMFGLLLLSILIFLSQRLFRRFDPVDAFLCAALGLLIVLSHYGTIAAMVLYGVAAFLAYSMVTRTRQKVLLSGLALVVGASIAVGLIYFLDAQRFHRILVYSSASLGNSLVAALFDGDSSRKVETVVSMAAILAFYSLLFVFYRMCIRQPTSLPVGDRTFWLANILFCGLLILPLFDEHLMGRLALFSNIPLVIILAYVERHGLRKPWLKTASVAVVASIVVLLAVGELVSSRLHNVNHRAILTDIRDLEARQPFDSNDLIVTRTGADHVCNWFFDVRAGVITSLSLQDFADYDNVYVLNPIDGQRSFEGLENKTVESESDRYLFMRRNIPRPDDVEPLFITENLEFFKLDRPPEEWMFTDDGDWLGYSGAGRSGGRR